MKYFNLLFDSNIENEKEHIFNTLTANKVDGIKMIDIPIISCILKSKRVNEIVLQLLSCYFGGT